ncbi:MAG: DUF4837 family protein [Bacteroidota bacterium]|jgi:hypothetical protein|nr:DUF4837 family protein [Bacteroidota bacterium]
MKYPFFIIAFISLLSACEPQTEESRTSNLPPSTGSNADIIVVIDSLHWAGPLGEEIRNTFKEPIPGLPQDEPYFFVNQVNPFQMNNVLRSVKNLVYVATLNNQSNAGRKLKSEFTRESIERISQNSDVFMLLKKNVFAKDQEVLHLFGNNEQELISNISKNRDQIRELFHKKEIERISRIIFTREVKGITRTLENDHQFSLRIPTGYEMVYNKKNFVWIRLFDRDVDKNIFVSYQDYTSEDIFKDENILKLRDLEVRKLGEDTDDVVYMKTETLIPIETETITFAGKYAVETRGLWKLSNNTMGGPFLSYVFVDEELKRLYYIEGYVYSPGKDKRNFMKEIEAILWTFKTKSQLKASN